MLKRQDKIWNKVDWLTVLIFFALVFVGWLNIVASVYDGESSIFSFDLNSGKQLLWIGASICLIIVIMTVDFKTYESLSYLIYGVFIATLLLVLIFGKEISGARSWFQFGGFGLQPSEFAKFATALALAKYMSDHPVKFEKLKDYLMLGLIIGLPMALILLQPDAGTAMVFGSLIIVLYREGLNPTIIIIGLIAVLLFVLTLFVEQLTLVISITVLTLLVVGIIIGIGVKTRKRITTVVIGAILVIGVVVSVDKIVTDVLKPHQQNRIKALINPDSDPLGFGFHVTQSKIAIGSGGAWGKGFLQGTQTRLDFVPEQSTDFIFCTLAEEHGWIGSFVVIALFIILLFRVINIAERQKVRFSRIYGYSVAAIIFFHFMVNIGMTIGLFPVIGIPLPFFSYGGSSLWAFTILLFILVKLDAHRMQRLR